MHLIHSLTGSPALGVICFLIFIEEVGVPLPLLPGDLLLLAAGYLASRHSGQLIYFMPLGYLSAVGGALLCYTISRRLGRLVVLRYGPRVGLSAGRLDRAEVWLGRHGARAIFAARILPGTRINSSIAAGCLELPLPAFVAGVIPSTAVWLAGFTLLGYYFGARVTRYVRLLDLAAGVLAVTLAVLVATGLWWRQRSRRRRPST